MNPSFFLESIIYSFLLCLSIVKDENRTGKADGNEILSRIAAYDHNDTKLSQFFLKAKCSIPVFNHSDSFSSTCISSAFHSG